MCRSAASASNQLASDPPGRTATPSSRQPASRHERPPSVVALPRRLAVFSGGDRYQSSPFGETMKRLVLALAALILLACAIPALFGAGSPRSLAPTLATDTYRARAETGDDA